MKVYVYNEDTLDVVAIAECHNESECLEKTFRFNTDGYGITFNKHGLNIDYDNIDLLP